MAWEFRGMNGPYYTRSRKVGGRVRREYVGKGLSARAVADADAHRRQDALETSNQLRQEAMKTADAERITEELIRVSDAIVTQVLESEGFHRHHRGDWRKRRDN